MKIVFAIITIVKQGKVKWCTRVVNIKLKHT